MNQNELHIRFAEISAKKTWCKNLDPLYIPLWFPRKIASSIFKNIGKKIMIKNIHLFKHSVTYFETH